MLARLFTVAMFLAPLAAPSPAAAKGNRTHAALAACALLDDAGNRLACYDALSVKLGLRKGPPKTEQWTVETKTDPLDDTSVVTAINSGEASRKTLRGPPLLVLRAQNGRTEAYISWGEYLGDSALVTLRIGDAEAQTSQWSVSTDHTATFYPADAIAFIRQLAQAERLVAQVTPYSESPQTVIFQLAGIDTILDQLAKAGDWAAKDVAAKRASAIMRGGIGIRFADPTRGQLASNGLPASATGVLLVEVKPGGLAQRAGLRTGDLVISMDGVGVQNAEALKSRLGKVVGGLTLTVWRGTKQMLFRVGPD